MDALGYDYQARPKERVVTCPVCRRRNASESAVDRAGYPIGVSRCSCSFAYLNPRLTAAGYAEFYEQWYRPILKALNGRAKDMDSKAFRILQQRHGAKLGRWVRAWGYDAVPRLLDAGGSTGSVAFGFESVLPAVHGVTVVDPAIDELKQAAARGYLSVLGTLEDEPVLPHRYDGILCTRTIDHCREPMKALQWLRSVLAPGGWLWIDLVETTVWKIDHPCYWTNDSLRLALDKAKFTPVHWVRWDNGKRLGFLCK